MVKVKVSSEFMKLTEATFVHLTFDKKAVRDAWSDFLNKLANLDSASGIEHYTDGEE